MDETIRFVDEIDLSILPTLSVVTADGRLPKKRWESWNMVTRAETIEEYCDAGPEPDVGYAGIIWTRETAWE